MQYATSRFVGTVLGEKDRRVLFLILFLSRAISTIKRILTQKAFVYPGFFLTSEFTSWHRKTHATFASSLTSTQVWSKPD